MGAIGNLFGGLFGGKPREPGVPMPPPAAHPPTLGSSQVALSGLEAGKKAAAAEGAGFDDTLETSGQGLKETPTTQKATLLGQ